MPKLYFFPLSPPSNLQKPCLRLFGKRVIKIGPTAPRPSWLLIRASDLGSFQPMSASVRPRAHSTWPQWDFYQFHYYPQTENPKTLLEVLPDLPPGLDRPIWLGEFPANVAGSPDSMRATLEAAFTSGSQGGTKLAGAAPWPMRDVGDGFGPANTEVLKEFFDAHSPDINSGVPPPGRQ